MAFVVNQELADLPGYSQLKEHADAMLQDRGLDGYVVEVRPATVLEEKAMAGEGLAPTQDSGDNFASDTGRLVIYRTTGADNPLLREVESEPEAAAETLVARLVEHLANHRAD